MIALQIPCPKCGAVLKLKDRSLLGRTGKCPKCAHRFVLAEPEEVELELARPDEEPLPVVGARFVPEGSPFASPGNPFAPAPAPVAPVFPAATEPAPDVPGDFAAFGTPDATAAGPSRFKEMQRKRAKRRRIEIAVGGVIALAIAGLVGGYVVYARKHPPAAPVAKAPPQRNAEYDAAVSGLEAEATGFAESGPTEGDPITLRYVPAGASCVLHLRPAELWGDGTIGQEVRYCLGPLADWAAAQIERYAFAPPSEVEEATICLILGARGTPPDVAAVFRYTTGRKPSDLILKFGGSTSEIGGAKVYVGPERAYMFGTRQDEADERGWPLVLATAPASLATDLGDAAAAPGLTADAVRRLLERTDRTRHLTFVFQPMDLRVHEESLAPTPLRPTWTAVLDRLGDDVEAAAWSVHFAGDEFFSELLVRNVSTRTPKQVHDSLRERLGELPEELVAAVSKMNPPELGNRKLIGRFPAMMQVFAAATVGGIDDRLVLLRTRLPERAGPNLALAGLLAWDESTRTDFTKAPAGSPSAPAAPKASLAERLKTPIEVDFRRTPLEEAFTYIGGEAKVTIEVDGEALKFAGYTKNMPQTFNLGKAPAEKAIGNILKQYDKMCVVLDEANDKVLVLTTAVAEERGLKPTPFAP